LEKLLFLRAYQFPMKYSKSSMNENQVTDQLCNKVVNAKWVTKFYY